MPQLQEIYHSSMTEDELIGSATVAVLAGQAVKLGEYKVQAGEVVMMGYGSKGGLDDAVGRIYANLKDNGATPAEMKGKIRFSVYSPQDRPLKIIHEFDLDIVNDNATDRTKQQPLPATGLFLTEDKKLVLEFISKTAGTLSKANSKILFDTTQGVV